MESCPQPLSQRSLEIAEHPNNCQVGEGQWVTLGITYKHGPHHCAQGKEVKRLVDKEISEHLASLVAE